VLVLLGFEKRTYDYVIIRPKELMRRLHAVHGAPKLHAVHGAPSQYHVDVWVTKQERAWLARKLGKEAEGRIAQNTFEDGHRDLTSFLNNWSAIKSL
jgi:hypothetical protein